MNEFLNYIFTAKEQIISLLFEHIKLTALSVGIAIIIGMPLGILTSYVKKLNKPILGIASVVQAIPSMALLGFAIPFLGIGTPPAIVMVVLYSLLPIIKNTTTGIDNINPDMIEASKGIGLTKFQVLVKVQIPLALPVIMSGIRISAVTAVGLMTMAAFIGGGGLGYLVFSGIRTVNNYQILAGAIPACILALVVDGLFSIVEKLVTPISLQKSNNKSKEAKIKARKIQKTILAATACILVGIFVVTGISHRISNKKVITIGSKDFTEQEILGNILSELIERKTDISVNRKFALGGTQVIFSAMKNGDVDMSVDYTGTAYGDELKYKPISDVEEVYNTVKKDFKDKYNIEVLKQMGFNNTYTLAVTKETAKKYNLKTISDLFKVSNDITATTTLEFLNREDGLVGLSKKYNLNFKNTVGIDGSPRYAALMNKESDVIDAFSTDGLLKKYDLSVLKDDKNFFPPYYAVPVVRAETLKKYPEIQPLVEGVGDLLNNDVMSELNYEVDELKKDPKDVAVDFLEKNGLI
ncbi:glycine betaine/L-proline ABC transporter permease/substrate-binding protein [Clostridium beijerinckii]|uniref:ABC transporter permease subunit n=1 Tax=Clostridium beijerinckii TaxID=1520 RepID=A0AB74V9W1_CLOBE|nr:glycine betaine ABC transporter substrate-binding protein [Clostridium beijerinckii]NRZ27387.1 osmoprotectant transport system permease protein [Clostridium beijerinckii]NYB96822.1 osmoprotectant transport system permease protein [Clostridium beijerinckii]OOM20245.1 carnitine transport binding protein OpuCC precursor [Clostridium beijerinckii]QUN33228.1 ABC transporter permease subunit [Clostridium beijerinckii]SQB19868.1 glycine/betaine ABC transporter substrate-binding protein [Clostridiu